MGRGFLSCRRSPALALAVAVILLTPGCGNLIEERYVLTRTAERPGGGVDLIRQEEWEAKRPGWMMYLDGLALYPIKWVVGWVNLASIAGSDRYRVKDAPVAWLLQMLPGTYIDPSAAQASPTGEAILVERAPAH